MTSGVRVRVGGLSCDPGIESSWSVSSSLHVERGKELVGTPTSQQQHEVHCGKKSLGFCVCLSMAGGPTGPTPALTLAGPCLPTVSVLLHETLKTFTARGLLGSEACA